MRVRRMRLCALLDVGDLCGGGRLRRRHSWQLGSWHLSFGCVGCWCIGCWCSVDGLGHARRFTLVRHFGRLCRLSCLGLLLGGGRRLVDGYGGVVDLDVVAYTVGDGLSHAALDARLSTSAGPAQFREVREHLPTREAERARQRVHPKLAGKILRRA